jgi:Cu/Ag efflux protein CusF
MGTSPRQKWPTPEENQDPFFEAFIALVNAQDASVFGLREDRDLLMMKGGNVSFTASSGLLSWSAGIEMNSAATGFRWTIPAGSVNLNDGDYIYTTLAHNPITNLNVAASTAAKLPGTNPDNTIILGIRNGDRVYFRDGRILIDAQTLPIFSSPPGGSTIGSPGQKWRENVTLVTGDSNTTNTPKVMGAWSMDADDYTINGTNKTFTFMAIANTEGPGVNGTVVLYDLTAAAVAATLTFNGLATPTKQTVAATISLVEHVYEVRAQLTLGSGTIFVHWAGLQIDNTLT